jgi:ribosomal protein S18 acetylase RimI-like enzyme
MEYDLRDATLEDVAALARLHVLTFRETHGGGPTEEVRAGQLSQSLAASVPPAFCLVLQNGKGELIGFVRGIEHNDSFNSDIGGELNKIYLLKAYHRRGLGKRLLCAAADRFMKNGVNSMLLFGDAQSPSNVFYEAMGAERLYSDLGEFHGAYVWRNLRLLTASCRNSGPSTVDR